MGSPRHLRCVPVGRNPSTASSVGGPPPFGKGGFMHNPSNLQPFRPPCERGLSPPQAVTGGFPRVVPRLCSQLVSSFNYPVDLDGPNRDFQPVTPIDATAPQKTENSSRFPFHTAPKSPHPSPGGGFLEQL